MSPLCGSRSLRINTHAVRHVSCRPPVLHTQPRLLQLTRRPVNSNAHSTSYDNPPVSSRQDPTNEYTSSTRVSYVVTSLTDQITAAEKLLQDAFQPGKAMPKAKAVATMRRHVADLKTALVDQLSSNSQDTVVLPDQLTLEARAAYMEVQRSRERKQAAKTAEMAAKIEALQVENQRLRSYAEWLLQRQRLLEDLLEEHLQTQNLLSPGV